MMNMESILSNFLSQPKLELGDRSQYIGASDVGQCPRKIVLSKRTPEKHDVNTLIRFERGNVVEQIIEKALTHAGVRYHSQLEVSHLEKPFTAHLDFTFVRPGAIAVLEAKSVSHIPEEPYPSWVAQLHFQMGLVQTQYHLPTRGGIIAVDLNSGEFQLFNGYHHNEALYEGLLEKADHIWSAIDSGTAAVTEKSNLCSFCRYIADCPAYDTEDLPELPIVDLVFDYLAAKEQEKAVKKDISRLRKDLEIAVKPFGEAKAGDFKLKLSKSSRKGFDTKAFKIKHPDLAEDYTKISSFTRLYVS